MRVGVKAPEVQELAEEQLHAHGDQATDLFRRRPREGDALDPLAHEGAPCGVPRVDGGDHDLRGGGGGGGTEEREEPAAAAVAAEARAQRLAKEALVVRLVEVVQLHPRAPGEPLQERLVVGGLPGREGTQSVHELAVGREQKEVERDRLQDVRSLDFDGDLLAGVRYVVACVSVRPGVVARRSQRAFVDLS